METNKTKQSASKNSAVAKPITKSSPAKSTTASNNRIISKINANKSTSTQNTSKQSVINNSQAKSKVEPKQSATKSVAMKSSTAPKQNATSAVTTSKVTPKQNTTKGTANTNSVAKQNTTKSVAIVANTAPKQTAHKSSVNIAQNQTTSKSSVKVTEKQTVQKTAPKKVSGKAEKKKEPWTREKKERLFCWIMIAIFSITTLVSSMVCIFRDDTVDVINYNYGRFDDNANFANLGIPSSQIGVDDSNWAGEKASVITDGYEKGSSRAPQTSTYLGTVTPVKPVSGIHDEHEKYGVDKYPSYGKNLGTLDTEKFNAIIKECRSLIPGGTWLSSKSYYFIDKDGYLLNNLGNKILYDSNKVDTSGSVENEEDSTKVGESEGEETELGSASSTGQYTGQYRMLYKHTTATTIYGGGLSDDEPRIVKKITCLARGGINCIGSKQITGLYAPAGEVIKIQMSKADYQLANGVQVYIGQNYNLDGQDGVSLEWSSSNGKTKAKGNGFTRMPNILSHFKFAVNTASPVVTVENDTVTFYVGSFWGGPIYIRPNTNNSERNISVTISGGVKYQHFILGVTTKEEYEDNAKSTAPYFDLEVYDAAIRFTTGRTTALKNMTYENCSDAAVLWDKITQVSKRVAPNGLTSGYAPINFIGDCYIAAGAAYANPGRNGVVCPPGWVASALNYKNFVNGGDWGSMHEYNHCWQGYGLGNGGEVTNNATTLISYTLYTRISQSRTMSGGLSGWNRYTDPSWSMCLALPSTAAGKKIYDLSAYATLLHNIGQDNFIKAARGGREAGSTVYYNQLVNATHYDMTYFFTDILNYSIGGETKGKGSITQSAVNAVKSKNYPVFIPVSSVYQVGRSIIYDNQKKYIITAQPFSYGSGEYTMDFNNYNGNGKFSNKNLVIPNGFSATVISVSQPKNGKVEMLGNNKVKYTPKNGKDGIYSGNFRVKLRIIQDKRHFVVEDVDLVINLKQSAGTTLNRTTYVYDDATTVPDTATVYNAGTKSFNFGNFASTETNKNVCTQETNTQIWAAGRNYDDSTYSDKSTNYRLMPLNKTLQTMEGVMYFSSANTYRFTLKGRGKATLYLSYDEGKTWGDKFTFNRTNTNNNQYVSSEYVEHNFAKNNSYVYFKVVLLVTIESDFFGIGVSAKSTRDETFAAFSNASAISSADVDLHKALVEESTKKFKTEYFYKNEYTYSYNQSYDASEQSLVSVSHASWAGADRGIENLFDGKTNTYYHSVQNVFITEEAPFELVASLGSVRKVNTVTFNFYNNKVGNNGQPTTFKLYGSKENKEGSYKLLVEKTNMKYSNLNPVKFDFEETDIQYYKLVVTDTDNHHYFAMASIKFEISYADGKRVAPNDFGVRYIGNSWSTENVLCNFGMIYKANRGDSVEFHFKGTKFAYFAYKSLDYGTVNIYVDGKLVAGGVSLSSDNNVGTLAYMYLGEALKNGDHVVKIEGKTGSFNVDSFVYWS